MLAEDLNQLNQYVKDNNIKIDFDLRNIMRLKEIFSKTIMVLNRKIDESRDKYELYIPYTDGKGPMSDLNLRRLSLDQK